MMPAGIADSLPGEQVDVADRLARERRARLAAERILEQKKRELYAANEELARHARILSSQIAEQRHGLERATEAATLAQRRLWAALETFRDGFAIFDREMKLVAANRAYLMAFPDDVKVEPGMGYDRILKIAATSGLVDLEGAEPQDWYHDMTARILRDRIDPRVIRFKSGRHVRLIDRRSQDGDLVSLAIDITESVRREAELDEARASAEAAVRAKSAFLANMTHELRTPMNGVVGMAELLLESPLSEEQKLFAETIRTSGEALLAIINDVLDYSKAEAQRLRLVPEPFDLELCIHEVMRIVQQPAAEKGLDLVVDYDPGLPTVFVADPGRMRQILTNLVGNAVKFTPKGHVLARVSGVPASAGGWRLQITVEDTGIGIAMDHAEHIFGEFNQVQDRPNRRYEGTGLGLAITRQLVELMGGSVWVESELGQGASFGIDLTFPAGGAVSAPPAALAGRRLLVAMQPGPARAVIERLLSAASAEVATGAMPPTGDPALEAVIMDEQNWAAWSATEARPDVPVLVVAHWGEPAAIDPPAQVVRRPVFRADLYGALAGLLGDRAAPGAPALPPGAPLRQMRVLAAEDNRTNQLVFRKMVRDFDIELIFAGDGHEAVALWQSFRPDLVFMDISMPGMDGREATREIRRIELSTGAGRVPIVALTAHALNGDEDAILAAGIDRYLTKPLRKSVISEAIAEFRPAGARPPVPGPAEGAQAEGRDGAAADAARTA